jgi:hypothetical protein
LLKLLLRLKRVDRGLDAMSSHEANCQGITNFQSKLADTGNCWLLDAIISSRASSGIALTPQNEGI